MIRAHLDVAASNAAIRDGTLAGVIGQVLGIATPEAANFHVENGRRTMRAVLEVADPSVIPQIAEPLFQAIDAEVGILPVITAPELEAGLGNWARARARAA